MPASTLQYSEVPERAAKNLESLFPDEDLIAERVAEYADVARRRPDTEGETEVLDGVTFTPLRPRRRRQGTRSLPLG